MKKLLSFILIAFLAIAVTLPVLADPRGDDDPEQMLSIQINN